MNSHRQAESGFVDSLEFSARVTGGTLWQMPPPPPKVPLPPVFPHRWASAFGEDEFGLWQAFEVKGVRQVLRWIPPGQFWMGSPEDEAGRVNGETRHLVMLTQGFWMADTACTQALWEAVVSDNPSLYKDDPANPVERVNWNDVKDKFLPELNRLVQGLEGKLPSEAQWEYACRAGTETPFWFGDWITTEQVNYNAELPYVDGARGVCREKSIAVKKLPPNGWGLYEMHGNVFEWCEDLHGPYPTEPVVDPKGPQDGINGHTRVLRGGGWNNFAWFVRSAHRIAHEPDIHNAILGFRLARGAD